MNRYLILVIVFLCMACNEDYKPKPKAYLRLDYPKAKYVSSKIDVPFTFETNVLAEKMSSKRMHAPTESYGVNIEYPSLKGTIFLTYKAIDNNDENLIKFIGDAEKFTKKHMKKADEIPSFPYENKAQKAYGALSIVKGNVASPVQFYVTDSVNHFLTGSLYFHAKPNYDSILPAANYLQKDIMQIMETVSWN